MSQLPHSPTFPLPPLPCVPFFTGLALLAATGAAPGAEAPALIPRPARLQLTTGTFQLLPQTVVSAAPDAAAEATHLAAALRSPTSLPLPLTPEPGAASVIRLELDSRLNARLGEEGYQLSVRPDRVLIRAAHAAGLFYGGVTFRQLLPPDSFATQPGRAAGWSAPGVEIEDLPRFPWRGLLLDPARHFMPPEFVRRFIDLMALHKLNRLQLHLTDDQGWRLEIKQYPRLTEVGSRRRESPQKGNRHQGDDTPYGPFYYTQDQIRDLVAYAQARHVTLVPEIEIPGHFRAALAAYPHLSCRGHHVAVRTRWGIEPDILCAGNDTAIDFIENVLDEVCALFPGSFIHIGGDEAPRDRWKECPKCQARLKAEGLQSEAQLQTWLNQRLEQFLERHRRRLIGWDEILEGGLTPRAAVMSWRGLEGGLAAASAGHDVVMSPTSHCYFDYAQAREPNEPETIGGFIPLEQVYAFEPLPPQLPPDRHRHILGAQGNLWSEFLWSPADVEYAAFPRATALAEVGWSPVDGRDFNDFRRRLEKHCGRLDALRVNYRRLAPR